MEFQRRMISQDAVVPEVRADQIAIRLKVLWFETGRHGGVQPAAYLDEPSFLAVMGQQIPDRGLVCRVARSLDVLDEFVSSKDRMSLEELSAAHFDLFVETANNMSIFSKQTEPSTLLLRLIDRNN